MRHLHVHQHQVEGAILRSLHGLNRLQPIRSHRHDVPALLQDSPGQLLVHRIVLRDQDLEPPRPWPRHRRIRAGRPFLRPGGRVEHRHDGVPQVRLLDRLGQVPRHPQLPAAGHFFRSAGRGEHQHRSPRPAGIALDSPGERETVHLGHPAVQEGKGEGPVPFVGALQDFQRLAAPFRDGRLQPPAGERLLQDPTIRGVVVHDQNPQAAKIGGGPPHSLPSRGSGRGEARGKVKGAADSRRALHPEFPAHESDQLAGDGQAEPRAAVPAGGGAVALGESLEHPGLLFRGDADAGVAHREPENNLPVPQRIQLAVDHHLAALGKLDGIPHQVEEDLAQAPGITHQRVGDIGTHVTGQLQPPLLRPEGQRLQGVGQGVPEIEGRLFHLQLAGLDLREVQDVVDEGQEGFRRVLDGGQVFALLARELGVQRQLRHPHDGVHGRADLVAHVGQEVALGAGGLLRPAFGPLQFLHQLGQARGVFLFRLPGRLQLLRVAAQRLFRAPALDELADLAPLGGQHLQEVFVRLPDFTAEEFHDAQDLTVQHDRKAEGGVQPLPVRRQGAGAIGVLHHVGDPGRPTTGPNPSRQSNPPRKVGLPAERVELLKGDRGRVPGVHAAQDAAGAVHLPESGVLPVQGFGDGLQDSGGRFGERSRFGKRQGGGVLGAETPLRRGPEGRVEALGIGHGPRSSWGGVGIDPFYRPGGPGVKCPLGRHRLVSASVRRSGTGHPGPPERECRQDTPRWGPRRRCGPERPKGPGE